MFTQEQKENLQKLVTALRSGEYKQAQGALSVPSLDSEGNLTGKYGYCCLGVAGKVLGISEKEMEKYEVSSITALPSTGGYLTQEVAEKFGFDDEMQRELARRNDAGEDFLRIADYVENFSQRD